MIYPCRLKHNVESMNEPKRWLEAIGEVGAHYLVLIRNAGDGVTSHVHAVLQSDYSVVEATSESVKRKKKPVEENADDFI